MEATAKFKITGWEEETITGIADGGKLTRAHVGKSYEGELQGEGKVEYLMMYRSDGTADFIGYEVVEAQLKGRKGSFVFEHRGYFKEGVATDTWTIAENSGSEGLSDIKGVVQFSESHKEEYEVTLNYEF